MKKQFILLLIILIAFKSNSQNIGGGNEFIKTPIEKSIDTFKISKTINIANDYYKKNKLDSAYYHYNIALENATSINYKPQIAECLYWIAVYFELTNKYQHAISYYFKASELYKELNKVERLAKTENYIGYNYFILNLDDKAIEYYFKSLKSYNSISDDDGVALNYIDIGNLYYDQENYTFAKKYFKDALEIYLKLDDNSGIAVSYTNLANVISDSGNITEGIEYFLKSIEIEKELNDEAGIAINYNNIGDNYSAIYVMDLEGKVLASTDTTFIHKNYAFRDYFTQSIKGDVYTDISIGVTSGELGYYFSSPIKEKEEIIF